MNTECSRELQGLLEGEIEALKLPGAAIAIYEKGEEKYCGCFGARDMEEGLLFEKDTILRIYSMTKPVTAVAYKILEERGLISQNDLLSQFLPEFGNCKVIKEGTLYPMEREIRIRDLLTMTSGIVYPDLDEAGKRMQRIFDGVSRKIGEGSGDTTREVIRKIASVPLAFQPGERWRYGLSTDVLGGVIEVVSGKSLRDFYKQEILDPLGMTDTDFYVPKEKQERLGQLYKRAQDGFVIDKNRHLGLSYGLIPPAFESAGAGLFSTLEDYSKFVRMLAGKGIYQGTRILSEKSVLDFQKNGLDERQLKTIDFDQLAGFGYGHFMRCRMDSSRIPGKGVQGEFGWDGWSGPYFNVVVEEDSAILFMVQISEFNRYDLIWKIHNIIYK